MYESYKPHPLLAQIPLTVSPFISVPTATILLYTYKSISTTLPPPILADGSSSGTEKACYVKSSGGHAAHPDDIITSCTALEEHMKKQRSEAETTIRAWEESTRAREFAEKRRVAPGWLDREEKLLQPVHKSLSKSAAQSQVNSLEGELAEQSKQITTSPMVPKNEGVELDRAAGGLGLR